MVLRNFFTVILALGLALARPNHAAAAPANANAIAATTVVIEPAGAAARTPLVGRMLLFIVPARGKHPPAKIEPGFVASDVDLIGFDVNLPAGRQVPVPTNADVFPKALGAFRAGLYDVQPLLDRQRMYSYDGTSNGDLFGPVQRVRFEPGKPVLIELSKRVVEPAPVSTAAVKLFSVRSASLSAFSHKPVSIEATIVLPVGYDARLHYPVVYVMTGFGGTYRTGFRLAALRGLMARDGLHAILVVADSSGPTGIAQFADSATNGPWGRAFTREFVPAVERAYSMGGGPSRRFLWGHSSGGWASLWLQVAYPEFFGGTWSSSPDPVDFHDFTGPDLLASPPDNAFVDRYGKPWQLVRLGARNVFTLRDFVRSSVVLGYRESQFGSFDAVFGPPGTDGKPLPLFDRHTGVVDPAVVAYWEARYDLASKIEAEWATLGPRLTNKIHIAVGTLDTFHLERGVLRLDARMRRLGVTPDITYFPGASHSSLFQKSTGFVGFHWAFRGLAAAARRVRPSNVAQAKH